MQSHRHGFSQCCVFEVQAIGDGQQQRRGQQHPFGVAADCAVAVHDWLDALGGQQHRQRGDQGARWMGLGVGAGFEYLGAEFVTHEDVVVQVDVHATAAPGRPFGHFQHLGAVGGEMQVGTADSACPHADEHLPGFGDRVGHVVAVDHSAVAQHRRAHQCTASFCSSTCSVMALTTASPARPINWSRLPLAQSWDARDASS